MTAVSEEKRTQAFKIRCYRRLLTLNTHTRVTKRSKQTLKNMSNAGSGQETEAIVVRPHPIIKGDSTGHTVTGKRRRARRKSKWEDNIKAWTWIH